MEGESADYVRPQPVIAVRNVRASSRWYRQLLQAEALPEHEHRDTYNRLLWDGQVVLQVHAWDEDTHPNLMNRGAAPPGHGVLLWFEVNNFDAAVRRARSLKAEIVEEPHVNLQAQHKEIWIRDPDGFVVSLRRPARLNWPFDQRFCASRPTGETKTNTACQRV